MKAPTPKNIKTIFDTYFEADVSVWKEFGKHITTREFKKNETIKEYHSTEKYLNILVSGSVGLFVWNGQDDICINLYYENDFFCDYLSFLKQKETSITSLALENCELWSIHYDNLQALYQKSMIGVHIGKVISEELFIKKQTEQIGLLTLTPTQRYQKLVEEKPKILQRTPLKIIASYLGVLPESLSRIRKKI